MSIKPVRPGGYAQNMVPTAVELAQIDQRLSTYGIDTLPAGDTVTGILSLKQDPLNPGTHPKMTGTLSPTVAGAVAGTGPGGGSLICSGSVPTYTAARPRRVRISPLELMRSSPTGSPITSGCAPVVDPQSGGVTQGLTTTLAYFFPITKPQDGATFLSFVAYYYVPNLPAATSGQMQIIAYRRNVLTGALDLLGENQVNKSGSPATWYANGAPQSIQVSTTVGTIPIGNVTFAPHGTDPIALATYSYIIGVGGTGWGVSGDLPLPVITGVEINYANVLDERLHQ